MQEKTPPFKFDVSRIHGMGTFTTRPVKQGERIGLALLKLRNTGDVHNDFHQTDLGNYLNHSPRPNLELDKDGWRYFVSAKKNVRSGEELTVNYRHKDSPVRKDPTGRWDELALMAKKKLAQVQRTRSMGEIVARRSLNKTAGAVSFVVGQQHGKASQGTPGERLRAARKIGDIGDIARMGGLGGILGSFVVKNPSAARKLFIGGLAAELGGLGLGFTSKRKYRRALEDLRRHRMEKRAYMPAVRFLTKGRTLPSIERIIAAEAKAPSRTEAILGGLMTGKHWSRVGGPLTKKERAALLMGAATPAPGAAPVAVSAIIGNRALGGLPSKFMDKTVVPLYKFLAKGPEPPRL